MSKKELVKVKMKATLANAKMTAIAGQTIELEKAIAYDLIENGYAVQEGYETTVQEIGEKRVASFNANNISPEQTETHPAEKEAEGSETDQADESEEQSENDAVEDIDADWTRPQEEAK